LILWSGYVGFRDGFGLFGLETFEVLEGGAPVFLSGIDALLEALELAVASTIALGQFEGFFGYRATVDGLIPEVGLDGAEAAQEPFAIDEDVDEGALGGSPGAVLVKVLVAEGFQVFGGFAEDDLGFGIDAGLERVLGSSGFALDGARTGGFLGVEAVGLDLFQGRHTTAM